VFFLGVVNDGNEPGEPRLDFQGDMHNFEFYLSKLRETYCIPDEQASMLAFTDGWTNPDTGAPMSPYPEASEANVKAEIARIGALANQHSDSTFFFFLSSHGIQYANAIGECPVERVAGSLSGLKAGDGETGDFYDCELGAALNANFAPTTRMFVDVDCSFCGGFSDSLTAASGTVPDGSVPVSAGVVGPNRIVVTGCAMTTECFGDSDSSRGGVSFGHMRDVLEGEHTCDGWTAPSFPDVQGFDVPVQSGPTDGNCSASEWFFATVDSAYQSLDPIAIQQQFRIKYGFASIDDDILILGGDGPTPTPTPTASPTPTPTPTPAPADLTISAMSASEQKPKAGDPVRIDVTVANTGTGNAGASTLELRLDDGTLLGNLDVPALATGATANVSQGWDTRGVSGQKVITATADVAGAVAEASESNNVGRLTVEIRGNKVKNGSFEQSDSSGNAPESWQGSSTGAGTTSYNQDSGGASDGADAVSISGTGGNALLSGVATWTSAPIAVSAGERLELAIDVKSVGLSSAPQVSVAYLGAAGQVLNTVKVLSAPLTTSGAFQTLSQTLVVPANVTSLRIVLAGFAPTDTRTKGTVSFDNVGLFAN
jgi:hypothetical protein